MKNGMNMKISYGFSLIEMAIVVIIISLILAGSLIPLATQKDNENIKLTQQRLEEIKEALLGFAVVHKSLPCPAVDANGVAVNPKNPDGTPNPDCAKEGYLPWTNLGVGRYDAWGKSFRYRVDDTYTRSPIKKSVSCDLRIKNTQNIYLTTKTTDSRVAAIIFSTGKDGEKEAEQNDPDKTYVQDVKHLKTGFDDILTWLSENTLIERQVMAKQWP
jgi:prepilin-type N-terminal cleavage/methylation domain-containing protein